jgi:transposase-like protein
MADKIRGQKMNIIQVYKQFPTQESCLEYLENVRWKDGTICPYCNSPNSTPLPKEKRHHCNNCNTSYSVTVGTIFHKTHLDFQKWFLAVSLILNAKKGISARQLSRDLQVNKNTAWFMEMRIRRAMSERYQRELLQGIVEMDETYVGGKPRRGSNLGNDGVHNKRGRGTKKTPVVGMIERGGSVKAEARIDRILNAKKLMSLAKSNINPQLSSVITDEYPSYNKFSSVFDHHTIDHRVRYAIGPIHTNNIESFWALLKRGINGQYHAVSKRHLNKYIDGFCYRHNNRKNGNVFNETIERALGVTQ